MAEELMMEPIAEVATKVARTFTTPQVVIIAAGAALGVGVTAYFFGKRRAEAQFDRRLEQELEKFREYINSRHGEEQETRKPSPAEIVEEKGYVEDDEVVEDVPVVPVRPTPYNQMSRPSTAPDQIVSRDGQDAWDYSLEVKARIANPEIPYVIHVDEFESNEPDHEQVIYTFYEADDVMVDEQNNTVPGFDEIVNLGNLLLFGHGSNDPNIVYVRNEDLGIDVEVIRDEGSFSETVHGHIEHSQKRAAKHKGKRRDRRFDDE